VPIGISSELVGKFKSHVSSYGANLYAGLLAVYMMVLHIYGGGDDFAVGIALANRNSEGLHDLIGYFANEVAVRAKFSPDISFEGLLSQVRENLLEAMANSDVHFHNVVKALGAPRDESTTPVFQVFFALQERRWWTLDDICSPNEDLQFKLKCFDSHISKFEVHMFIREDESGGVVGDLTISTDLFEESTGQVRQG
jgi:non-ribosomal peptide synthetase component F